ncbi:recombination directionality factor [Nocardioides ochotonae]|uniref:recombination directionality factor n=1 Tax=Nocardioides ochotonae TaxID=2685869 RepID=UPI001CD5851A|nr:hypothetical protein [Nocardioides ochotonae]
MAGLRIFGDADTATTAPKRRTDDVVGRFRSGYVANNMPVALSDWRVTTGDPEVAERVAELLNGDEPQTWDATGEDNLEVFTKSTSVEVILDGPRALRQAMVLYGRKGILRVSDGETITYPEEDKGKPDPQAGQSLQERKDAARAGTGAEPRIELFFRLADAPDLGVFKFQSGSWSLARDLAYFGTEDELADYDGPVRATLALEPVSFVAKSGPRAGQNVSYTKPVIKILGDA